jgi:hypothetical protein
MKLWYKDLKPTKIEVEIVLGGRSGGSLQLHGKKTKEQQQAKISILESKEST